MGRASMLDGVVLAFQEAMAGAVGDRPLSFEVKIRIGDLGRFLGEPEHRAELTGTVTCPGLGGTMPVRDGVFQLFVVDAPSGVRQLRYSFHFTAAGGGTYYLYGHKDVHDDPGLDVVKDMTCRSFPPDRRNIDIESLRYRFFTVMAQGSQDHVMFADG